MEGKQKRKHELSKFRDQTSKQHGQLTNINGLIRIDVAFITL